MSEYSYQSPQNIDLPIHRINKKLHVRYAHGRSKEAREFNDVGQDYLSFTMDNNRMVFAVCDGVGMSFYGDVAAQFLGNQLVNILKDAKFAASARMEESVEELKRQLNDLTIEATQLIQSIEIPLETNKWVSSVLEDKRKHGSETTFICGRMDYPGDGAGRLLLFWLGDSKCRLWLHGDELILDPKGFNTEQRWSTRRGCIGGVPVVLEISLDPAQEVQLLAYTDGLPLLNQSEAIPDDLALKEMFEQALLAPESDDMTFLHLAWSSLEENG